MRLAADGGPLDYLSQPGARRSRHRHTQPGFRRSCCSGGHHQQHHIGERGCGRSRDRCSRRPRGAACRCACGLGIEALRPTGKKAPVNSTKQHIDPDPTCPDCRNPLCFQPSPSGGMADAADSKSAEGNLVRVRLSPRALYRTMTYAPHLSIRRKGLYPGCAPIAPTVLPPGKRAYPVPSQEVLSCELCCG